jgi:hypothetical protein
MLIFKGKVRASGVDPSDFMFIRCLVVFAFSGIGIAALNKDIYPKILRPEYEPKEGRKTRCCYFWSR